MKIFNVILLIFLSCAVFAQQHPKKRNNEFGKRFEDLEKIKLLEILDLDENDAIKFFARRNEYKKKLADIKSEGEELLLEMEGSLGLEEQSNKFSSYIAKSIEIERKFLLEKSNFYTSVEDILSKEQIVKLILFEKKFKRDIRDLLIERGRKKYRREREN